MEFTKEAISLATAKQICNASFIKKYMALSTDEKKGVLETILKRCEDLGVSVEFKMMFADAFAWSPEDLEKNTRGVVQSTIGNYIDVFRHDEYFSNIRFNLMTMSAEVMEKDHYRRWNDTDDAEAMLYVENTYHFLKEQNYAKAMRVYFKDKQYHPVKDIIEAIEWDGKSRIEDFLHKWTKCEDTPYTREASRLIFAGGINRLYMPGCKFDDMVVLIGTNQGEGKSTIVRWLALNDKFFAEVNDFDGQRGTEATEGAWICEVSELLALTKTKEQEAVKSYLTRQVERYRMPYDRHVSERPRQCIFIGTTNKQQFLTDRSGNRRFYPVEVASVGYDLFDQEDEVRDYIEQCWAEAKALYDQGKLYAFANRSILESVREKQAQAEEDDYRVGMIERYLGCKNQVCAAQLWTDALNNDLAKMTKKDSSELSMIMAKVKGWTRSKTASKEFGAYGKQRYWYRDKPIDEDEGNELPF